MKLINSIVMEEVYNKKHFYCTIFGGDQLLSYLYEKPLGASHLKPIEDFLFDGKELTPFSHELFTYQEARQCVLDFDIYTMQENYKKYPNIVDFLMDCYRYAAQEGVMEAYNNIGVYLGMTNRIEEAVPWFEGAADAGLATGMRNLMCYYGSKGDYDRQFYYAKKLAGLGNAGGMWNCAVSYHFGYMGRERNIDKAKAMYEKMMSLALKDDTKEWDYDDNQLVFLKTYANINLAKIRLMTEEHSEENLKDILYMMEETPYVLTSRADHEKLRNEIQSML